VLTRREFLGGAVLLVPILRTRGWAADRCALADPNKLGPYYRAGAPQRTSLCDSNEPGDPFALDGRVIGDDCKPIAGALVEVWHADASGEYDMLAPQKPRNPAVYHLRAVLRSGKDGAFAFDTVVPGPYGQRARHIHLAFHADGYEPFITQSYFAGDPRIATDTIARKRNVVDPHPDKVRGRAGKRGRFEVAMRRRRPLPADIRAALSAYEGNYRFPDGEIAHVVRGGDSLYSDVPGYGRCEMLLDARDRGRVLEFDATVRAEMGPDGKVAALLAQSYGDRKPTRAVRVR
jgi:catechol 1,2-dioxygenase